MSEPKPLKIRKWLCAGNCRAGIGSGSMICLSLTGRICASPSARSAPDARSHATAGESESRSGADKRSLLQLAGDEIEGAEGCNCIREVSALHKQIECR